MRARLTSDAVETVHNVNPPIIQEEVKNMDAVSCKLSVNWEDNERFYNQDKQTSLNEGISDNKNSSKDGEKLPMVSDPKDLPTPNIMSKTEP